MKSVKFFLSVILILLFLSVNAQNDKKHIVGITYGFEYMDEDIWVGDPYNAWIKQTSSNIVEMFYYYKLSQLFHIGTYIDFENMKFDAYSSSKQISKRLGIGALWLGHYPNKNIQFQLGGFSGYSYGIIKNEDVKNRSGVEYGIIAGPAIEYNDFGIAVHFYAGFSWYPSKNLIPDEFGYSNSKIKIKVYYHFQSNPFSKKVKL